MVWWPFRKSDHNAISCDWALTLNEAQQPVWRFKSHSICTLLNPFHWVMSKRTARSALFALCEGNTKFMIGFHSRSVSHKGNVSLLWRYDELLTCEKVVGVDEIMGMFLFIPEARKTESPGINHGGAIPLPHGILPGHLLQSFEHECFRVMQDLVGPITAIFTLTTAVPNFCKNDEKYVENMCTYKM